MQNINPHCLPSYPEEKMPSTKIAAFIQEFPRVKDYVRGTITQVYVSRLTPETLPFSPRSLYPDHEPVDQVFLLDKEWQMVERERLVKRRFRPFLFFGPTWGFDTCRKITGKLWTDETLARKINDLGADADRIRFVLWARPYGRHGNAVILYKAPKNATITSWLAQEIEDEKIALRKEVEEIDSEAA